jgi:hypothetical protein
MNTRRSKRVFIILIAVFFIMTAYMGIQITHAQEFLNDFRDAGSSIAMVELPPIQGRDNLEYINTALLTGVFALLGYALVMVRNNEVTNREINVALVGYGGKGGGIVDRLDLLEKGRHHNESMIKEQSSHLNLIDANLTSVRAKTEKLETEFRSCQLEHRAREG